jgi:hypothetical protein
MIALDDREDFGQTRSVRGNNVIIFVCTDDVRNNRNMLSTNELRPHESAIPANQDWSNFPPITLVPH